MSLWQRLNSFVTSQESSNSLYNQYLIHDLIKTIKSEKSDGKVVSNKNILVKFVKNAKWQHSYFSDPYLARLLNATRNLKLSLNLIKHAMIRQKKKQFIDFSATLNLIALARRNVVQCEIKYINLILRSKLFLFFFFKSENYLKSKFIRTIKEKSIYCQFVVCLFSSNNFISAEPIGPKFKQGLCLCTSKILKICLKNVNLKFFGNSIL